MTAGAFNIGAVVAEIKADLSNFEQGIRTAEQKTEGLRGTFEKVGSSIADFGQKAAIFTGIVATGLGLVAKSALEQATNFEQSRVSFETMLGSADKAKKLMAEVSDFALKTPFELPQLVEGAKRLLAYNIESEKIIPTLRMLGDIAAGVGTDKLPQLILAYGQVSAATKLTGAELRQFSEAGVPVLEALVNKANEAGGALTKVGGASKETTSKMTGLSTQIVDAEWKMKYFKETGGKTDKQLQGLQQTIDMNKKKLGEFGPVGEATFKRVQATAADMIQKISDGEVKFTDLDAALQGMTGEGGRFFQLMEKQSKTFGGVMSNVRDQITRTLLSIMGVEVTGDIRENSLFAKAKQGAEALFAFLQQATPVIQGFVEAGVDKIGQAFNFLSTALAPLGEWIKENQELVMTFLKGMGIALGALLVIGTITALIGLLLNPLTLVALAIAALYTAWQTNFWGMRDILTGFWSFFVDLFENLFKPFFELFVGWFTERWTFIQIWITGVWEIIKGIIMMAWGIIYGVITAGLALLQGDWQGAWDQIIKGAKMFWDGLVSIFAGIINATIGFAGTILGKLVAPFEEAWRRASEFVEKIKDALDFTKRHSPSVMDILNNSVRLANKAMDGLNFDVSMNHTATAASALATNANSMMNNIEISLPGAMISNPQDAMRYGETIGNSIIKKLLLTVRA